MDFEKLYTVLPKQSIKWTVADMEKFLNFIGLTNLSAKFSKNDLILEQLTVDGSCLKDLTQQDLRGQLDIKSSITIKKIMRCTNFLIQGITYGLKQYDNYLKQVLGSRMEIESAPMDLASLTQKPKLSKNRSIQPEIVPPYDLMNRSSYKSVPEEHHINPAHLPKKQIHKSPSAGLHIEGPRVSEIQENSILSEPQEDKKKQLELIIHQSDGPQTSFFSVKEEGAKIGRHSSNQILILDESISRFHAEIKFHENTFLLRDTGSTTGTFIKLVGKNQIWNNMIIQMGSNQFLSKVEDGILTLQVIQGSSIGYRIQIPNHKMVSIGRKQSNLINFSEDQHLSNTHATFIPSGDKFFIEDMGTTNGTWMRLSFEGDTSESFELSDKTVFKIGSSQTYVCTIKTTFISQRSNPNACIICYENDKDCVYMPCKHNAACIRCSKNLKQCPICRLKIDDFVRIYKN